MFAVQLLTHHRLQFHRTCDEIIEQHRAIWTAVPMRQCVQHPIVQPIAGRIQSVAQLKRVQVARMIPIVQLKDGLPLGNVAQQFLELFEAQFAGAVTIVHCHHGTANVLGESVLIVTGRQNCNRMEAENCLCRIRLAIKAFRKI